MSLAVVTALAALCVSSVCSQTIFNLTAPRDPTQPVTGDYSGPLRPSVHFSPPAGFMNDPNGMFKDEDGVWHLYYQYNPTDIVAGNQHWGHATSEDLYHWTNQAIAIFPSGDVGEGIFSGSAVVDVNNTSGFFPDQTNGVVAIYTLHTSTEETQDIAYSHDSGYTFTKYAQNPVLSIGSYQFRDPKVFWYKDHWVMVVAYAQEFTLGIYTSPNLIKWTHASNFSHHGLLGLQYECPNLVEMPFEGSGSPAWLLAISINPGAPLGGSIQQYFPGSFNGTHFTAFDGAARIADFAKDNYAGQFFGGIPGTQDQVMLGWANNWQYAQVVPTGTLEGWRSVMTLPRTTYLKNITRLGYNLISKPYDLEPVLGQQLISRTGGNVSIALNYANVTSGAIHLNLTVAKIPDSSPQGTLNFTFTSSTSPTQSTLSGGYFFGGDPVLWLDRGKVHGYDNPFFTDRFSVSTLTRPDGKLTIELVVDRSIVEAFVNGGEQSGTSVFYPDAPLDGLVVAAAGLSPDMEVGIVVTELTDAWATAADSDGLVRGNVTAS